MAKKHLKIFRGRILDVGCGYMPYKKMLTECDYVGMDLDASRNPDIIGSVLNIPQKDYSFDGAIFSEVIEHIPEPGIALSEIKRCLRTGGILYITAPQSWNIHYAPNDYFRFTKYGLMYLLEKHGFELITIEKVGGAGSLISSALIVFIAEKITLPIIFFVMKKTQIRRGAYRLTALLLSPLVCSLYLFSVIIDHFDSDNVLGWAAVAKKG